MKNILPFLVLLLLAYGCKQQTQNINSGANFWAHHFSQAHDVAYGNGEDQKLDIYSQGEWIGEPTYWKSDTLLHPTLVYIHGGGWLGGTKDQITPFIIPFLEKGYNVVTVEYTRKAGTAPQAIDDCMLALKWLSRNYKSYNIDKDKIVISGESAGGHLALITAMLNTNPGSHPDYCGDSLHFAAVVNWYGVTDIKAIDEYCRKTDPATSFAGIWAGSPARLDTIAAQYSPVNRVTPQTPPVITIQGTKDSVVPPEQATALHKKLLEAGVRNELVKIEYGKHLGFTDEGFKLAYTRVFAFLAEK
jgi:acetyl esterase/lipase